MRLWKEYLTFTSLFYRVIMLILIPLGFIGGSIILKAKSQNGSYFFVFFVLLIFVEVYMDYYLFGGITSKDGTDMDLLKTSHYGKNLLKNAIRMDLLQKGMIFLILAGIGILYRTGSTADSVGAVMMADEAMAAYAAVEIGILAGRYMSYRAYVLLISYGCILLWVGMSILISLQSYVMMFILIAVMIAAGYFVVKNVMRKMERSYYD